MAVIDLTAQMVPVGMGVIALFAMTVAGIGSCLDDSEREASRGCAQRVGAWWLKRGSGDQKLARAAFALPTSPTDAWLADRLFTSVRLAD
jgi:hypothetical protein